MDYSAVGETTVLAARMEQTATPGSIRLSAATLRLVEGLVQVTALGPVPVKGLAEPVEVFELVGASPLRRRLQAAAARGLTPFVGRQPELDALHQALAQAQAGHGQVVALVGEAGVGKSRLVYIADVPEAALHRSLAHLQAAEFLYETRLFPEPEYTFKHALTYEVAFGSLLLERRRVLHARLVEAIEALAPDRGSQGTAGRSADQVERLAHHALRGEVWDKAVPCCQEAGTRAWAGAAFRESVVYFEQALQALGHLPEDGDTRVLAIELRLALGGALQPLGEYGRRLALLGEAEALARALDDRARLGQVLALMARVLRITGDLDGAMAVGRQALELAAALGDSAIQVQASYHLGQAYYTIGDLGRAAEILRRNVEAADREADRLSTDVRIQSQAWLVRILGALGAFAEGRRYGEEALRLATLAGRGETPIVAHGCLGDLYLAQGDLEHAIRVLDQGLALCRASGYRSSFLRSIMADLGSAYVLQGRLAEGRVLLEEGIGESIRTGSLSNHSRCVAQLSEGWRLAGRTEEAWQHARQALVLARQLKERRNEARAAPAWRRPCPRRPPRCHAGRNPLPAGPHPRRRAWHAPAPGSLPPRARSAVRPDWPWCAGPCCPGHRHRPVPRHGDDLLAPASRGGAGAGGKRAMKCFGGGSGSMETVETYRKLVQHLLQAHANEEEGAEGVEVQLVCDTVHDHYQLWYVGWQGEHRIRGCVLQVDIKDGKIWIQYDGTETGLACALVQAGVPKEDIVLAFHAPHKRPYTGYAVA
jgi:tetratricopeptide (TPR) repeat protein